MGKPVFFAENFFNTKANPGYTLTSVSEIVEHEDWRVGTARRETRNYWSPTATNALAWLRLDLGETRYFDTLALERGHNLEGHAVELRVSNDNWSTYTTPLDETLPTSTVAGMRLDLSPGVRTYEGAYLKRFAGTAARWIEFRIPAMGAGLRPVITGLYLGQSLELTNGAILPFSDGRVQLAYDEILSPSLWAASSRKASRRTSGSVPIQIPLVDGEEELVERHLTDLFWDGRFMWIVTNTDRAERSVLAYSPVGDHGPVISGVDRFGLLSVNWHEAQPLPR